MRGEELLRRGVEEERDEEWTEMVGVREDGVGVKGVEMKEGARGGFTNSF